MKPEFESYLLSLGMPTTLRDSIESTSNILAPLAGQEFQDMHVSEYVDSEGHRFFEDVVYFTYTHMWGAKIFPRFDSIDSTRIKGQILAWKITQKNYDFILAQNTSQATLDIRFIGNGNIHGELKASGPNCDHLFGIVKKYIVPNTFEKAENYAPANISGGE